MAWWTCVFLLCVTTVLADGDWLEVEIEQGPVRGQKHPNGDVYAFYNIPYATGPSGEDKFKPPLPPPTWTEPFNATGEKGIMCPQNSFMFDSIPVEVKEDCLIANVFVPDTTEKDLSVLVYVHGGGFVSGFSNWFQATQFIREKKDFIMVTFNYRLGIHGFLCLGTEDIPGNAGMKDQVELLRWVQKNIASFGGNPNDVTLVGSSAGSVSVELIMLSKSAENLFHRVIPESGGSLAAFAIQRDPLEIARTYAKEINELAMVDDMNSLERFYKTTSIDALTADSFFDRTDSTFLFSPCVERNTSGAFLTESPLNILKKGDYKKLPMLYGFANMEGLLRINFFETWKNKMNEKFSDFLPADLQFGSDAERLQVANMVKKFYFGFDPVRNQNILKYIEFFSDVIITFPMLWASKLLVEAGHNQVYLYEYSFVDENTPVVPHTNVRGADHCAQTFAWLDPRDAVPDTPQFQKMRATVREIWHNFMKTGTPVPEGSSLPEWPALGADMSPHMVLNENLELRGVLLPVRKLFWDDMYAKHYRDSVPPRSGAGSMAQKNMFTLLTLYVIIYFTKKIIVE
ncbi:hypothetical protein PYW07_014430 [Mythimna separata]|uniref:Carboxylic ester hydrolase n=1 Tax=Mythimna separata TaxID=271217 RepID=A0AAD7Z0Y6_MYTSE|nr:hypothetical protein PYW07_014430 [Mythimna separata]